MWAYIAGEKEMEIEADEPILKSLVVFLISSMRSAPNFLTLGRSSSMEKDRSIR